MVVAATTLALHSNVENAIMEMHADSSTRSMVLAKEKEKVRAVTVAGVFALLTSAARARMATLAGLSTRFKIAVGRAKAKGATAEKVSGSGQGLSTMLTSPLFETCRLHPRD
jgi:hypothetical protein